MTGTRLPDGFHGAPGRGAYWRDEDGTWSVCTPNGRIGSVAKHTVDEHEDGTITVTPSILVYAIDGVKYDAETRAKLVESHGVAYVESWERGCQAFHGYLIRGVWTTLPE